MAPVKMDGAGVVAAVNNCSRLCGVLPCLPTGACADLYTEPAGALAIGTFSGILSVFGYVYLTPYLQRKIGLYDTCGST